MKGQVPDTLVIEALFSSIAGAYDRVNWLLSLGRYGRWLDEAARQACDGAELRLLDVGTGTGELALRLAGRAGPGSVVWGVDCSEPMISRARQKAGRRVRFARGYAESLPFPGGCFDCVCMSFVLRNLPRPQPALAEAARVTRAGGRLIVLELGKHPPPLLDRFIRAHLRHWAPLLGGEPYRWLDLSRQLFPPAYIQDRWLAGAGWVVEHRARLAWGLVELVRASLPGQVGEHHAGRRQEWREQH
ncbi:MAG: class I SAM-dependent methyltransferase [bacterium]|nr:class I SAM-dependent methyltransferase [bacterium]